MRPKGRNHDRERRDHRPHSEKRPSANALYGVLPVLEALRSNNRRVEKIVVADGARQPRLNEIFDLAREHRIVIATVPRDRLE